MLWFLAREVLRLRGQLGRSEPWDVMPDLFFYREPEEAAKEEQQQVEHHEQFDQNQGQNQEQDWDNNGTTISVVRARRDFGNSQRAHDRKCCRNV